ncbi:MAG: histidine kinase [Acidobacteria bacterium]|nr:histidine kinase [Acidobacteriota bacterium]
MPRKANVKIGQSRSRRFFGRFFRLAQVLILCAAPLFAERLPVKTYTVADGLLRDGVHKIRQDSRGFLWICTGEGVSRFDGAGITNFTVADGLPNRFVYDFLETRNGAIYIATGKGLARLNPHGLRGSKENPLFTVFLPDNPKAERIQNLFEDKNGQVWVGTSDGLYKLIENGVQKTAFESVALDKSKYETLAIGDIIEDRRGTLWVGTSNDLFRISPDGAVLRRLTLADGLSGNIVISLLEDRDGQIWAGFYNTGGLCLLDAETVEVKKCFSGKDGLPALWMGSGCGAKKIARYGFTTYSEEDGLDFAYTSSTFENRAGELFVTTTFGDRRKISRFDGDKFLTVEPRLSEAVNYLGWGWQQTVWQDSTGAWWIPTGQGVFRTAPTSFENLARTAAERQPFGGKEKEVFRLFEDSRGDIWIARANSEIWRWERAANVWHDYTAQARLAPDRLVSAFVEDRDGSVWIGTGSDDSVGYYEGLLIRYRDGEFRRFTEKEGAPCGWMRDLFLDSRGRLWIASTEDGLFRLDDTNADDLNFFRYTSPNGLTSNATASVTEDQYGRIYTGTWRGIDRITPETGQIENFTTADGLPGSFIETAYRDRRNNLWFATRKGLAQFQPEPLRQRKPPTVLIMGLRVEGEPQAVSILGETEIPRLELNSDQNQIGVDFLGLGASLGEKLKYEYRLGDSADWTPTTERTLNFANLAPGEYRFEVRAASADKIYSAPALLQFKIAVPVWQQWWFVALVALVAGLTIYFFYRNRVAQLLEIERTRTRIATDLHDDIGTNLSKISLLSEIVNLQLADGNAKNKQMLASIAEISRESVASMSDIIWAINPHRDSTDELTSRMREHAEEIFLEKGVQVRFNAPPDGGQIKLPDGRGFDVSQKREGNGLENMKRRAAMNRGRFAVESKIGGGTTVEIEFPQH